MFPITVYGRFTDLDFEGEQYFFRDTIVLNVEPVVIKICQTGYSYLQRIEYRYLQFFRNYQITEHFSVSRREACTIVYSLGLHRLMWQNDSVITHRSEFEVKDQAYKS